jgi:superfamily II DNA/RNA helicase
MQNFNELELPSALKQALEAMKFEKPTPIQAQAIPVALSGRDLIGCAQTGTGKTAAFSIPIVSRLLKNPRKSALILVPTRELAAQIADVLQSLLKFSPEISGALLIGGMSMKAQIKAIQRKPRIIVATPGRLVDHLNRGTISISSAEILVLDEADRMLDMGFAPQLNQILRFLPKSRQTLFFSATLPSDIEKLSARFLKDPARVTVGAVSQPVQSIQQSVVETTVAKKNDSLMDELNLRKGSVLIFARTQARTDRVARYLEQFGHPVTRLHGGRTQGQRNSAIAGFRDGRYRILVATDIAARGIDISHIAHVINYDLPQAPADYVHRIGRTARAGAEGQAVSLLTPEDRSQWREISRLITKSGGAKQKLKVAR